MAASISRIHGSSVLHAPSTPTVRLRLPSITAVKMSATASTSRSYWTSVSVDIEAYLKQALPIRPPLSVFEPMHHLTFSAPPTAAPALCIAACELVGGHKDQAIAAASAIHLMHAASYSHEQLPLTGKPPPKTKRRFGPNIELLTSDGMVPFGVELLARMNESSSQADSERILRVIVEITRAMGSQGLVEGQYNMLQYSQPAGEEAYRVSVIDRVCKKKEGEVHGCAASCGAILGGGSEAEIENVRRYGEYVGMIEGIRKLVEKDERWKVLLKEVKEIREMALNELKCFDQVKIEAISSFAKFEML